MGHLLEGDQMENAVGRPILSAAAPGSHAAAMGVDLPIMIALAVFALGGLIWFTWKVYSKTR